MYTHSFLLLSSSTCTILIAVNRWNKDDVKGIIKSVKEKLKRSKQGWVIKDNVRINFFTWIDTVTKVRFHVAGNTGVTGASFSCPGS